MVQAGEILFQTGVDNQKVETLGALGRLRVRLAEVVEGWRRECQLYDDQIHGAAAKQIIESASKIHDENATGALGSGETVRRLGHGVFTFVEKNDAKLWAAPFGLSAKLLGRLRNAVQPKSVSAAFSEAPASE